ncbi:MAG: hypothetical protein AAGG48_17535 [Planctomycetota bacterium]
MSIDLEQVIREARKQCKVIARRMAAHSVAGVRIGKEIQQLAEYLHAHGFKQKDLLELLAEFGISRRACYYYLSAARAFGDVPEELLERIELGAVKLLSSRNVKPEIRQQAFTLLEQGRVTEDDARRLLGSSTTRSVPRMRVKLSDVVIVVEGADRSESILVILQRAVQELQQSTIGDVA